MKKYMVMAVFAMIAIMALGMLNTGAWFSDSDSTATQGLKAGTLKLGEAGFNSFDLGTISNIYPGWVSDEVQIDIVNKGSIDLAWLGDLVVSDSILKNVVYIKTAKMEFLRPDGGTWEPVDPFITDGIGSGTWPTVWTGPGNLATLAVYDGTSNMAPGTRFEHMGALKPGYKYRLTLQFAMYEGAGNEYQAAGPLNLRFEVVAGQINGDALNALTGYSTMGNHITWFNQQIAKQFIP